MRVTRGIWGAHFLTGVHSQEPEERGRPRRLERRGPTVARGEVSRGGRAAPRRIVGCDCATASAFATSWSKRSMRTVGLNPGWAKSPSSVAGSDQRLASLKPSMVSSAAKLIDWAAPEPSEAGR